MGGTHGASGDQNTANAVKISPDGGTVFVTGESAQTASAYDYATVAYQG